MEQEHISAFEADLAGRCCSVTRREHDWFFDFGEGWRLRVAATWRIVAAGRIALAEQDDGQQFGHPAPLDGEALARELLEARRIAAAVVDRQTADLELIFEEGTRLQVFNDSSGYEGWDARFPAAGGWRLLVGLGGGAIASLSEDSGLEGATRH